MKDFSYKILPIILSLLGIGLTIYSDFFKENYSLTLYMNSEHTIIKNESGISDIELTFKNKVINELHSTRFLIENSGNKHIDKDFTVSPLEVELVGVKILDTKIHSSFPIKNDFKVEYKENKFIFNYSLFNSGDFIEIDILTTDKVNKFNASTRIKGLKEIDVYHFGENPPLLDRVSNYQIAAIPLSIFILFWFRKGARKLVVPIRATAYYIKDELKPKDFEADFFMRFLKRSTEEMLDDEVLNKIEKRLTETDINNNESLDKFREETFFDLLNRDISGSMLIVFGYIFIWVLYNIGSLIYSLMYV